MSQCSQLELERRRGLHQVWRRRSRGLVIIWGKEGGSLLVVGRCEGHCHLVRAEAKRAVGGKQAWVVQRRQKIIDPARHPSGLEVVRVETPGQPCVETTGQKSVVVGG